MSARYCCCCCCVCMCDCSTFVCCRYLVCSTTSSIKNKQAKKSHKKKEEDKRSIFLLAGVQAATLYHCHTHIHPHENRTRFSLCSIPLRTDFRYVLVLFFATLGLRFSIIVLFMFYARRLSNVVHVFRAQYQKYASQLTFVCAVICYLSNELTIQHISMKNNPIISGLHRTFSKWMSFFATIHKLRATTPFGALRIQTYW